MKKKGGQAYRNASVIYTTLIKLSEENRRQRIFFNLYPKSDLNQLPVVLAVCYIQHFVTLH